MWIVDIKQKQKKRVEKGQGAVNIDLRHCPAEADTLAQYLQAI